jgi:hypothetical protein
MHLRLPPCFVLFLAVLAPVTAAEHPLASSVPPQAEVAQLFIDDMTVPNAIRPVKIDYGWTYKPRVGSGNIIPKDWTHSMMWGQVYIGRPGNPARNVRVQIRDCAQWVLSRKTGKWALLQHSVAPEGAAYAEDFKEDANIPADVRSEPDGSASVLLKPGYNYHFWPEKGRARVEPADIAGLATVFFARLVVNDPALPDDRDQALLIASCGGDYWRSLDAAWKSDWSNNHDWGMGRFKRLTKDWQPFTACTHGKAIENDKWTASAKADLPSDFASALAEDTLRATPPPLRALLGLE